MMDFMKIVNSVRHVNRCIVRNYAFKSDLKIKWNRPEKIPCIKPEKSGDVGKLPPVNPKDFLLGFRDSQELKNADENVKSIFQFGNNKTIHRDKFLKETYVREVQRHSQDFGSMEARLGYMTGKIRTYQEHMEKYPRHIKIKVILKELIDRRKKFLKYLRRWDYKRFEWILEKLDLVYKPPPNEFKWITRKDSLCKLTDIHCENIKQQRLDEYRSKLEKEQIPFLEEKIKNLEFIRKEQTECQVPVTVSQEEITGVKKQLKELLELREQLKTPVKT